MTNSDDNAINVLAPIDAEIMAKIAKKSFRTFCTYYVADKQDFRTFQTNLSRGFCRCEQCQTI